MTFTFESWWLLWLQLSIIGIYMLPLHFIAVMALKPMHQDGRLKNLHWTFRWLAWTYLIVGLAIDGMTGQLVFTPMYAHPPVLSDGPGVIRWLVTDIVRYHLEQGPQSSIFDFMLGKGWRYKLSIFWCANFMTPFDKTHCGDKFAAYLDSRK